MQQIADWLEKLGLSEYAQRFAENAIDLSVIRDLTEQDLKDLGILLSTSDNSDPNVNGRAYWAVLPRAMIAEETGSISYRIPQQ